MNSSGPRTIRSAVSTSRAGDTDGFTELLFRRLPAGRVLNLGAGTTGYSGRGKLVVNADHADLPKYGPGWFVKADAAALPFKDGAFSGTILKDVLEHVPYPVEVLREVQRVSAGQALLILTTPRAIARAVWDDPTHIRGFTARALLRALHLGGWLPSREPRRVGGFPGAARLGLTNHLERIMRVPIFGHWFGTNWIIEARPAGR